MLKKWNTQPIYRTGEIFYIPQKKMFEGPRYPSIIVLAPQRIDPLPQHCGLHVRFPKDIYTYLAGCLRSTFDLICCFNHFLNLHTTHKESKFGLWKSINAVYKTWAPCQLLSDMLLKYCWLLSFHGTLLYC